MPKLKSLITQFIIVLGIVACSKNTAKAPEIFSPAPGEILVSPSFPGEVSGMVASYSRPGYIWMLQDKDNPAELLTVKESGEQGPTVSITGADNQDWEDMTIGAGPVSGKKYLYIADAGDNFAVFNQYCIYRVEEPEPGSSASAAAEKIRFVYDDGIHHNTEAVILDPDNRNILLVTKDIPAQVFELAYPYSTATINTATKKLTLKQATLTGAAVSPDGAEILLRSYTAMYYWKRKSGQGLLATLQEEPKEIPVLSEPQGESVCFKPDNSGFFTFSENAGLPVQLILYFYSRK